jgi:tRNA-dihydrouridine synthase
MAELSHRALRELVESMGGCDEYFTEMISAGGMLSGGPFEAFYLDGGPRPEKTVYQLVGADADQLVKAAALLDRRECAGIDINMGCSAPLIRKTGAGAGWMAQADKAGELIARVRKSTKKRLSVKLRAGFTGDFDYLLRFCRRLEEAGTELITLHPRTVTEKFRRRAKWDYVYRLRQELRIPVAGNGDIADAAELVEKAGGTGSFAGDRASDGDRASAGGGISGGIMVGRAAVRRPWIFAQARHLLGHHGRMGTEPQKTPFPVAAAGESAFSPPSLKETGLRFLDLLARFQPPEFHLSRARRFFSYFCDNLAWSTYVKNLLNREENLAGIEKVWVKYFETGNSL